MNRDAEQKVSLLTNWEVLDVLEKYPTNYPRIRFADTFRSRVVDYLQASGSAPTPERVGEYFSKMSTVTTDGKPLAAAQMMQLANLRPTQAVQVHTILSGAEDEELDAVAQLTRQLLGTPDETRTTVAGSASTAVTDKAVAEEPPQRDEPVPEADPAPADDEQMEVADDKSSVASVE